MPAIHPTPDPTNLPPPPSKTPRNVNTTSAKPPHPPHVHVQHTLAHPQWAYIHLSPITASTLPTPTPKPHPSSHKNHASIPKPPLHLDPITLRLHLTSALSQYLGDHGAAIPVDILHIAPDRQQDIYIRVPVEDGSAVVAAVGGWQGVWGGEAVGYRVRGRSEWLACLVGGAGGGERRLFDFG